MNDTNNPENNAQITPPAGQTPTQPSGNPVIQPIGQVEQTATPTETPPPQPVIIAPQKATPPKTFTMQTTHNPPDEDPKRGGFRAWYTRHAGLISLLQLIGGPILLVIVINAYIFQPYQVYGSSMVSTLQEGDRLIINKFGKSWARLIRGDHIPKRGDIIVFKTTLKDNIQLIKRVIALPGERVVVEDGVITVYNKESPNGFNPDDGWQKNLPDARTGDNKDVTLGPNELFVSGDNRTPGGSLDSRNDLGLITTDDVVGELIFRMFPLNDAQVF